MNAKRKSESANLDLLRAIAVLSVFAHHALQFAGYENGPGKFGVLVFFVHTCLVLLISLERLEDGRPGLVRSFYIRRAFRIYPLSIACVLLVLFFQVPYDRHVGSAYEPFRWLPWRDIAANLMLIQNVTGSTNVTPPLWSLPYEVQMYLVLPFIYFFLRRRRGLQYPLGLWLAGVVIGLVEKRVFGTSLTFYAGCFMGGAVAYRTAEMVRPRLPAIAWPITILTLMAYYLYAGHPGVSQVVCLLLGISFPLFVEVQNRPVKQMAHLIAKYSYGIYLSHLPILWLCFVRLADQSVWLRVASFVILAVTIPVAAYHGLEHPMIRLGSRLAEALRREPETPSASKFHMAAGGSSR